MKSKTNLFGNYKTCSDSNWARDREYEADIFIFHDVLSSMTGKTKGSGGEAVVGEAGQRIGAQAVTIRERNAELTAGMPCDPFKYPFIHSHVNRFVVIAQKIAVYSIASIQIPLYCMPGWNLSFSWNTVLKLWLDHCHVPLCHPRVTTWPNKKCIKPRKQHRSELSRRFAPLPSAYLSQDGSSLFRRRRV